ncbi:MAG: NTP transferase domain-containing protein [Propionibacteriaceae bacterium]|jgi:bifunctional UDP-N-acetylglucosamine pyrophosphorylase/glucosamine-1-phosphate N-acetyltransferase|nr:NTP transferase domain-containing protein [Propionibacteriaceae bacterium]
MSNPTVIVLAAGEGTRMKSKQSKLLHTIAGRTLLAHAIDAVEPLRPERLVVVVGHQRDDVVAKLGTVAPYAITAVQEELRGTGDAVRVALAALDAENPVTGDVVVTMGDVPLLQGDTLLDMVAKHRGAGAAVTVMTAVSDDPTGYGRIVREGDRVVRIVEHRDATEAELAIDEINSGVFVFDAEVLRSGLARLTADNVQQQLYLTDVIELAAADGGFVAAYLNPDVWQSEGVNDRVQLARLTAEYNRRMVEGWMRAGVSVIDPSSTWIDADVDIAPDVTLLPGVELHGATSIAADAVIGPYTTLKSCEVGEGARVVRVHAELAEIGDGARVGPFVELKPGDTVEPGARVSPASPR